MTLKDRLNEWGKNNGFKYYSPAIEDLIDVAEHPEALLGWKKAHDIDPNGKASADLDGAIRAAQDQVVLNRVTSEVLAPTKQ